MSKEKEITTSIGFVNFYGNSPAMNLLEDEGLKGNKNSKKKFKKFRKNLMNFFKRKRH